MSRPAETLTFAAGLAVIVGYMVGWEDQHPGVIALAAVFAGLPAVVTGIVEWKRSLKDGGGDTGGE